MRYTVQSNTPSPIKLNQNDTVESILQNISLLLSTKKGTVPMYREFGLPMEFVDKPLAVAQTLMIAEITEAIGTFEPRAELTSVSFSNDMNGRTITIVEVEI